MQPEDTPWNIKCTVAVVVHPGSADHRTRQHEERKTKKHTQANLGQERHLRSSEDENGDGNNCSLLENTNHGSRVFNLLAMSLRASRTGPLQNVKVKAAREMGSSGMHFAVTSVNLVRPGVQGKLTSTCPKIWTGYQLLQDHIQPRDGCENDRNPIVSYPRSWHRQQERAEERKVAELDHEDSGPQECHVSK